MKRQSAGNKSSYSDHELNVLVDVLTSITPMSIVCDRFSESWSQSALRSGQLKWKNKIGYLFKVTAYVSNLVDDVLETYDVPS